MRIFKCAVAALALAGFTTSALAAGVAKIDTVAGKVLVNRGAGYEAVASGTLLNAGDKVMVGDKSSATISYFSAKCSVSAQASSLLTVGDVAPCKKGEVVGAVDSVFAIPVADMDAPAAAYPAGLPLLLAGTAAVGIATLILVSDDNDDGVSGE
jgi:hypothetical protein